MIKLNIVYCSRFQIFMRIIRETPVYFRVFACFNSSLRNQAVYGL